MHSVLTLVAPVLHDHVVEVIRFGGDVKTWRHAVEGKEAGAALCRAEGHEDSSRGSSCASENSGYSEMGTW